jgi:hypothetical protein
MRHSYACNSQEHTLSRRQILGGFAGAAVAAASGGIASLLSPAFAAEVKKHRKQVIFIWLDGGMSQLESWDPKPNTQFGGPYRAIPTSVPGVHISELLPQSAKQMHRLSIVRCMHTKDDSHSSGVARIERGDPKNRGVPYPYFGSAVAKFLGPGDSKLPPYIWIKPYSGGFKYDHAGFLGPTYGALALGDGKPPENLLRDPSISADVDAARNDFRKKAEERFAKGHRRADVDANSYAYDMAAQLMVRSDLFDKSKIDPRDVERYGSHDLGRHVLQGRRLLEAGVTFVQVTSYHWDTHGDNFNLHRCLVPQFDQPFSALVEDLHDRGMLDHTLVVAMSEFGRTPRINSHVGRDHWPQAWSVAMAGCGLAAGAVVGKTNALGTWVTDAEYDVGHLFHTWFNAVGIDTAKERYDNHGQPLPVANEDTQPIKELLV